MSHNESKIKLFFVRLSQLFRKDDIYSIAPLFVFAGYDLTDNQLLVVAEKSGILQTSDDFLDPSVRQKCEAVIPDPLKFKKDDWVNGYIQLRRDVNM